MNEAQRLWDECAGILQAQVSEPVWLTSFEAARAVSLEGGVLTLAVPSFLAKERIEGRYLSLVRDALTEIGAADVELALEIAPSEPEPSWTVAPPTRRARAAGGRDATVHDINPRYTFDTFVIGPSNRFAHAAALAVAETPARKYNPLFIYGDAGLGKTHLLQAIGHYVRENYPTYRVRYVTSETFLNEFIDAVRTGTNDAFKRRYRDIDVLLVDDIQFIEGKKETQEEFFHTFNHLHQANRQIVLSSDRPPDAIGTLEDRLRSRFKMGLITDVQPPDLETRLAILRNKAEREATWVPARGARVHRHQHHRQHPGARGRAHPGGRLRQPHLGAAHDRDGVVGARRPPHRHAAPARSRPQVILEATSKMFGIPIEEIIGKKRQRPLVTARQVAMYVFRDLTDLSYPAIAREFGGRDHTTVIHAVEKISAQMRTQRPTYDQVTELVQTIRAEA